MNRYVIREQVGQAMTAATKAHEDVEFFLKRRGYRPLTVRLHDLSKQGLTDKVRRHGQYLSDWWRIYRTVDDNSLLLIQYPLKLNAPFKEKFLQALREKKGVKTVFLIHDLEHLRNLSGQGHEGEEQELDALSDAIICHNDRMKAYLMDKGIPEKKLFTLELFDYRATVLKGERQTARGSVIVAGNLDPQKSVYVYSLRDIPEIDFDLYGVNYDNSRPADNIHYHGAFPSEDLPAVMGGAFGLVWDGTSVDTCAGNTGNYLRYNDPHKLSLYLAAGIPVIVWEQAAVATLVQQYGVGICVSSLKELPEKLTTLPAAQYRKMVHNAAWLSEKLTDGAFLDRVMDEVENALN